MVELQTVTVLALSLEQDSRAETEVVLVVDYLIAFRPTWVLVEAV